MIFVDSNIWCYYFDRSLPEHLTVAKTLDTLLKKEKLAVNTVMVTEISHYLIKNLGPIKGREKIKIFLSFPLELLNFNYSEMKKSVDLLSEYSHTGIGGRDATILASMKVKGITKLLTHDWAFKKIDFIEVVDPIRD